jgi:glycine oxidase
MKQKQMIVDVLIVGGGVIGWSIAYYLSQAGCAVCLLDPRKQGGNASRVAAGLICPSPQLTKETPFTRIALASVRLFPSLRDELASASGIDIQLRTCGTLRIATSEEQAVHQKKRLPAQQKLGINLSWLEPEEVRNIEPAITVPLFGAVYGPEEGHIAGPRLMQAYRIAALRQNVRQEPVKALRLLVKGTRIAGVATRDGEIKARHTILAGGAWTPEILQSLGYAVPIEPERGQLVVLDQVSQPPQHIIFGEQIYLAPKTKRTVIIGGMKDRAHFNEHPSAAGTSELLRKGLLISEHLAGANVKAIYAGVRPRTPDGLPLIGPLPGWEGVSIAAGHNSNGLLLSAITGQIIAALILHQPAPIEMQPYLPERFFQEARLSLTS